MARDWPAALDHSLPEYLAAQRWFSGSEPARPDEVRIERIERLWSDDGDRALWQVLVLVGPGPDQDSYQLLLGMRPAGEPAEFLHGHESTVLGAAEGVYLYDAVWDRDLAKILLEVVSGGTQKAERARPMTAEQSNSSLVYDDRLILKVFRRLRPGRNPDVEVSTALARAGFAHVAAPIVEWRNDKYDLAFGQEFLAGGTDGWALALASLRQLYASRGSDLPGESGGDFAAEAGRLGAVTAEMHVALHGVFGAAPAEVARARWTALVDGLSGRLRVAGAAAGRDLLSASARILTRLREVEDPGPVFHVHGDFHLGQVMRTDLGWYVLDFEGEPARPMAERLAPASPLKDVTGMLRSLHYASRHALVERALPEWADIEPAARAWEAHNRQAFLDGYQGSPAISRLLPDPAAAPAVMTGYELDKALYEVEYELSHRPEWVSIPLDAIERLVEGERPVEGGGSG